MHPKESKRPDTPERTPWQLVLTRVTTGLFILNQLLGGRFAISFPPYVNQVSQAKAQETDSYTYYFPLIAQQLDPDQLMTTTTFLPLIFVPPTDIRDNPYCRQQFSEADNYTLNTQEQEIEQQLLTDPGQEHPNLTLSIALSQAARRRAQDMADREYFAHTNPDGYGPNCIVLQGEFVLPDYYNFSNDANNVESIIAGQGDMSEAWKTLVASQGHSAHLLGKGDFYNEQSYYGIGYVNVPGSQYGHYLVIIIAKKK